MKEEDLKKLAEDPKAFFLRAADAERETWVIQEEIAHYYDLATGITQVMRQAVSFTGGPGRKVEECVVGMVELEEELSEKLRAYLRIVKSMQEAISWIKAPTQKRILVLRYTCGRSWAGVSESLGLSERWVYRQHAAALEEIQQTAKERINGL